MITPEGDYLSNLQAPDLRPYFKHLHWRKMGHSMGHLVASDWADKAVDDPVFGLYKNCGLWTRDEAAILWNIKMQVGGCWVDIGAHTGWTTAHLMCASPVTAAVDPMLAVSEFRERLQDNHFVLPLPEIGWCMIFETTSHAFFESLNDGPPTQGFVIDGDHEPGKPLEDAQNAYKHLADTGVVLFHDFIGAPVREAVTWLMNQGFKARVYYSPHLVACCWRGDFTPPDHEKDARIDWTPHIRQMRKDFDFSRLS